MNTPERPLHDYVADVCEHTAVRRGVPLPWGPMKPRGASTSRYSAVMPPASDWSCLINLWMQRRPDLSTSIPDATARVTCGMYGLKGFVPVNSMPTVWMARINPVKDIVSISTGCCSTHLRLRSRRCLIGILVRHEDMTRLRRSETWFVQKPMTADPCRNAWSLMSTSTGMTTGRSGIPGQGQ